MSTFLITCIGSRGDVQPFVALGLGLVENFPGCNVNFVTHPEFEGLIKGHNKDFGFYPITLSTMEALKSPEGIAVKTAVNPLTALSKVRSFVKVCAKSWFEDLLSAINITRPSLLFVSTMPFFSSIQCVAKEMGIPVIIMHTVPAYPTRHFAPPTAGMGYSSTFKWINKLAWHTGSKLVYRYVYRDIVNEILKKNGFPTRIFGYDDEILEERHAVTFIYSSKLSERPPDWPENLHIVGSLQIKASQSKSIIPTALMDFIQKCRKDSLPIIYIGLGSMLNVMFDTPSEIARILDILSEGAFTCPRKIGIILHTVAGSNEKYKPKKRNDSLQFILEESIPHSLLFPEISGVVHHGGMGTTHAAIMVGKPSLILPCGPTSDQPFWADLIVRKKLGPRGFLIQKSSVKKFRASLVSLIDGLDVYARNAHQLASEMQKEDSIENIVGIVKSIIK